MAQAIRKAVIPAAGLGTRLLPLTKAIPKELLPVGDRPAIQYVVEEALAAGIGEVILVLSKRKEALSHYFAADPELEGWLTRQGKEALLEGLHRLTRHLKMTTVYQEEPLGLGHAVLCAHRAVGEEPFLVMLPDDLGEAEPPLSVQLLDVYEKHGQGVLALERVSWEEVSRYGIVRGEEKEKRVYEIQDLIEKPSPEAAPSNLAIVGRYILPPTLFPLLAQASPGAGGEIQLTDALRELRKREGLWGCEFVGLRHDTGTLLGLLETNIRLALKNPQWQPHLYALFQELSLPQRSPAS